MLRSWLEQAQKGRSPLVFIVGDPGIGKTTLIRQFLAQMSATAPLWIGTGQGIEHVGTGEAYLPLLEALGRLAREPGNEHVLAALRRTAPMWLVHLPQLVAPGELEVLHRQGQGMGSERLLRQFVDALTVVTQETVVVLVLEDLQWSDRATVETLAYLARRPEPLRLLVLGTYPSFPGRWRCTLSAVRRHGGRCGTDSMQRSRHSAAVRIRQPWPYGLATTPPSRR